MAGESGSVSVTLGAAGAAVSTVKLAAGRGQVGVLGGVGCADLEEVGSV